MLKQAALFLHLRILSVVHTKKNRRRPEGDDGP